MVFICFLFKLLSELCDNFVLFLKYRLIFFGVGYLFFYILIEIGSLRGYNLYISRGR